MDELLFSFIVRAPLSHSLQCMKRVRVISVLVEQLNLALLHLLVFHQKPLAEYVL